MTSYQAGSLIHGPYKRRRWFRRQQPVLRLDTELEPMTFLHRALRAMARLIGGQ